MLTKVNGSESNPEQTKVKQAKWTHLKNGNERDVDWNRDAQLKAVLNNLSETQVLAARYCLVLYDTGYMTVAFCGRWSNSSMQNLVRSTVSSSIETSTKMHKEKVYQLPAVQEGMAKLAQDVTEEQRRKMGYLA